MTAKDIEQTIRGENPAVQILQSLGVAYTTLGTKALTRGFNSFTPGHETGIIFIIDGMSYGDNIENIRWLNAFDIESAKFTNNSGAALKYGGINARSGILEITLKDPINEHSRLNNLNPERNLGLNSIQGFEVKRKFNNLPDNNKDNIPDLRTTIYWNPNIIIDETGKINIIFKTSNVAGEFECIINGICPLVGYPGSDKTEIIVN